MFDFLSWVLESIWSAAKTVWQGAWNVLVQGWTWAVGLIVIVVGCVTQVINAFCGVLEGIADAVVNLGKPNSTPDFSAASDFLAVANHFFPVSEMFALLVLLSVTWLIMLSYRLVKSWIPTLS